MSKFESCLYCKHNICSVTYDLVSGRALYHKNTCKITHKEKKDSDACKRYKFKHSIVAA